MFSNFLTGSLAFSCALTRSLSFWTSISFLASSKASMSSYMVTGRTGSLWKASLNEISGTVRGISSSKKLSSISSNSGSAGGSDLVRVESDCSLRIFHAIRISFPATIMSNSSVSVAPMVFISVRTICQ